MLQVDNPESGNSTITLSLLRFHRNLQDHFKHHHQSGISLRTFSSCFQDFAVQQLRNMHPRTAETSIRGMNEKSAYSERSFPTIPTSERNKVWGKRGGERVPHACAQPPGVHHWPACGQQWGRSENRSGVPERVVVPSAFFSTGSGATQESVEISSLTSQGQLLGGRGSRNIP